jgi:uncharacterized protein
MHVGIVYLLLLGLAVGWLIVVIYTAWLLSHPPRRGYAFAVSRGLPGDPGELLGSTPTWTTWTFPASSGGSLPVWDIAGLDPRGPMVIVTHGWGDSRVVMLSRVKTLVREASRVILWDLPGHGDAPGVCALGGREAADLAALVEACGESRVVLYGFSLGAGVSIVAAAELGGRVEGVIAEAPYRLPHTPARNMLELRGLPFRTTLRPALALIGMFVARAPRWAWARNGDAFDRALHAHRLHASTRLLVIHGEQDAICPLDDGKLIAEQGRGEVCVITHGAHSELWTDPAATERVSKRVQAFVQGLVASPAGASTTPQTSGVV